MNYQVRGAQVADSQAILHLLSRTPQPGRITLNFERHPCYFHGAQVSCEQPDVYVAEEHGSGRVIGVFNVGRRTLYVNGLPQPVRYAHDLRVDPSYRGTRLLYDMYKVLRDLVDDPEWLQAVILADNAHFLKAVSAAKSGLPRFLPYGVIETSMIFGSRRARVPASELEIRPATAADVPEMQWFLDRQGPLKQFFPRYRLQEMLVRSPFFRGLQPSDFWLAFSGERLVGIVGVWDQKGFKQTRVVGYSRAINSLRHLYNLHNLVRGGPHLPGAGGQLSYLTLHSVIVEDNRPELFKALLDTLYAHFGRDYDALVCGFFEEDPLRRVLEPFRRETLRSQHFLMAYQGDPRLTLDSRRVPFADIARL